MEGSSETMADNPPIVVGVNGSFEGLRAARWAGAVAERLGVSLHILTATPYLGRNLSDVAAAIRAAAIVDHRETAELVLEETKKSVLEDRPALVVTTAESTIPANEALSAASATARLLVLACDDVTALGELLIGSTTLATLVHSKCPIVAWRGASTAPTHQPIVVGVDGCASDGGALGVAFELADRFGAPLRVVYSWSVERPAIATNQPVQIQWNASTRAQWRRLNRVVDRWRILHPHVEVAVVCEPVKPGRALEIQSVGAQLVVVGSRRRNTTTQRLFGSTSLHLLHHCSAPVLLCPFDEHERYNQNSAPPLHGHAGSST
jgi:nucleotide-binding universal stress UspA family protein